MFSVDKNAEPLSVQDMSFQFLKALQNGRLHHAFLVTGAQNHHKHRLVETLSQNLLQIHNIYVSPNFLLIDPHDADTESRKNKQISVESIRTLENFCRKTSSNASYRIAVIRGAEYMNYNASNALLKVLEEPGDNTVIFLTTDTIGKISTTIRSRCSIMHCGRMPKDDFKHAMLSHNILSTEPSIELLFNVSGGDIEIAEHICRTDAFSIVKKIEGCFKEGKHGYIKEITEFATQNNLSWDIVKLSMLYYVHAIVAEKAKHSLRSLNNEILKKADTLRELIILSEVSHLDRAKIIMSCLTCAPL